MAIEDTQGLIDLLLEQRDKVASRYHVSLKFHYVNHITTCTRPDMQLQYNPGVQITMIQHQNCIIGSGVTMVTLHLCSNSIMTNT